MAENSIISGVRAYIAACPLLSEIAPNKRHVDWTDEDPDNYGIFPDNDDLLRRYISGSELRQYSFAVNSRRMSETDAKRLNNSEFLERFRWWIKQSGLLPILPDGFTPIQIEAVKTTFLYFDEKRKTGVYQIQVNLEYKKE
jgi:hypothetical protein